MSIQSPLHYQSTLIVSNFELTQRIEELTSQERKILRLTILEFSCKEIAEQLFISTETVKKHRKNILKKLQVKGKMQFRRLLRYVESQNLGALPPNYP